MTCARTTWEELRFSVSWKAYCFVDVGEREAWRDHTDDLELASVLETLVDDLARRGVPDVSTSGTALGTQLIDTYIRFPAAEDARR